MAEHSLVWVGNRESEIEFCCELFAHSITVYGSGIGNNISLINPYSDHYTVGVRSDFFADKIQELLILNDGYRFLFYNNQTANAVLRKFPNLTNCILCVNDSTILSYLNSKAYTKMWLSHQLPVIRYALLSKQEISYDQLKKIFNKDESFVIQDDRSSSGIGTYFYTEDNADTISSKLSDSQLFIASPFVKDSYSVNCHLIISETEILIYPPSLQIVEKTDNQLIYKGSDFITANTDIPDETKNQLRKHCEVIGEMLQGTSYRGICGVDFHISSETIFMMEVNPRFQASSFLLDLSLREQFGIGLIETHMAAFNNSILMEHMEAAKNVIISFSSIAFFLYSDYKFYQHILNQLESVPDTYIICKDKQNISPVSPERYLFRAVFKVPLTSIDCDGNLTLHQNLQNPLNIDATNFIDLKIALLTQGVKVLLDASEHYKIKEATFDAVDIIIGDNVINCPVKGIFTPLTPWSIKLHQKALSLYYLENYITDIKIDMQERLTIQTTKNGWSVHKISNRTTDRVRVRHTRACHYKQSNHGCAFCHATVKINDTFTLEDIYETIDHYINEISFRHFLIGGPSSVYHEEENKILSIAKYIRSKCDKPICVMSVPPQDISILSEYKKNGVTGLSYNLEIFDRTLAKKIMPGKGQIPLAQYTQAFVEGVKLFGRNGAIRSMLLIGLDKETSLLSGIQFLCELGVSPMLSPFRPLTATPLAMRMPPDIKMVDRVVQEARIICNQYNVNLGPPCEMCQNNTLL